MKYLEVSKAKNKSKWGGRQKQLNSVIYIYIYFAFPPPGMTAALIRASFCFNRCRLPFLYYLRIEMQIQAMILNVLLNALVLCMSSGDDVIFDSVQCGCYRVLCSLAELRMNTWFRHKPSRLLLTE